MLAGYIYAAALLLLLAGCQNDSGSVLSYIRRVTMVTIPAHIKTNAEFDNMEFEAGGKYQLAPKDIPAFLAGNPFRPIDHPGSSGSLFNKFCQAGLAPLKDTIPLSGPTQLRYFQYCRNNIAWHFTINEKSGELWIEVRYPDISGQGPCTPSIALEVIMQH